MIHLTQGTFGSTLEYHLPLFIQIDYLKKKERKI